MLLDKNRKVNLDAHWIIMNRMIARGVPRKEASEKAYDLVLEMPLVERMELVAAEKERDKIKPEWKLNPDGRMELKLSNGGLTATLDWEGPDRVEGLVTGCMVLKPCTDMETGQIVAQTALRAMLRTALRELNALEGKDLDFGLEDEDEKNRI